jgi:hypothetical protein
MDCLLMRLCATHAESPELRHEQLFSKIKSAIMVGYEVSGSVKVTIAAEERES